MIHTMMFTHGMSIRMTHHSGRFTTFRSTKMFRIGMIAVHPR